MCVCVCKTYVTLQLHMSMCYNTHQRSVGVDMNNFVVIFFTYE